MPPDTDVAAFVWSKNGPRRHLKAGQKAIAFAMLHPKAEHGGVRQPGASLGSKLDGFSKASLSQARKILDHSRDLAESVLRGTEVR